MYFEQFKENEYHIKDVVYGTVIGCNRKGVLLKLNNGEEAFSSFAPLAPGTKVLCTILKKSPDKMRGLVTIDSVLNEIARVA